MSKSTHNTSKGVIVGWKKVDQQQNPTTKINYQIQKITHAPQQKINPVKENEKKWQLPSQINNNNKYGLQNIRKQLALNNQFQSSSLQTNDKFQQDTFKSQFNKKKSQETYSASTAKQSKQTKQQSQNSYLQKLNNQFKMFSAPKQIFDYLKTGDMQKFLIEFEKLESNKNRIRQMKAFFKDQQDFYKKLKFIITNNNDSSDFYEDKSFNFFQEIPQLFNRILVEISRRLMKLEPFKQGNKPYLASNTSKKIQDNFDKFMIAIYSIASDKDKDNDEKRQLLIKLRNKQEQINELRLKIQEMKIERIQSKSGQNDQSRRLYQQSMQNNENLKRKMRQLSGLIQEKQRQSQELWSKITIMSEQNKTLKFNSVGLIEKISKSDKLIRQLQDQLQTLKQEKPKKYIDTLSIPSTKPLITQTQLQNLKSQLQSKQKQVLNFKRINYQLGSKQNQFIKIIRQLEDRLKQSSVKQQQNNSRYYLQSSELLDFKDTTEKYRLINMIGDYTRSQPQQFKLLFRYQPFTQPNLHYYIDNKVNFLILIRLVNNVVIGGFCPYPMMKSSYPYAGFIFNLTSNSMYPLKQGKPCFIYDEFYFTMGNSQIRIRIGDNFMYSSFGTQNQHFNSKNHSIGHFLHGYDAKNIQRQMPFKGYEIYQVNFKN